MFKKAPANTLKPREIFFLVGPTGVGKSMSAINLAKKINAEIISCDSMQVYRKMDILTSKVPLGQRKKIKHHLIGILDPFQEYDVAKYRSSVLSIFAKLFLKNKVPLIVGGTGLYYSIIIDGLFPEVPQDKVIRAKLNKQLALKGSGYLYKKLIKVDPLAGKKIHPNDSRRIIRALEVYLKTGKQISVLQKSRSGLGKEYKIKIFGLNADRKLLYSKINQRVDHMFDAGIVKEVKRLLQQKISRTAACAIGIRQLKGYFDGAYSLDTARSLIQRDSRHYAKRQITWFKKDKRVQWINIKEKETPEETARRIYAKIRG